MSLFPETSHERRVDWCPVWDFRLHVAKHFHGNAVSLFSHSNRSTLPRGRLRLNSSPMIIRCPCMSWFEHKKSFPRERCNNLKREVGISFIQDSIAREYASSVLELSRVFRWQVTLPSTSLRSWLKRKGAGAFYSGDIRSAKWIEKRQAFHSWPTEEKTLWDALSPTLEIKSLKGIHGNFQPPSMAALLLRECSQQLPCLLTC